MTTGSRMASMLYVDDASPPLGANNVQDAIDALKANAALHDNPLFIPSPGPAHDADTTAAALFALEEPVQEWTPSATRNINPEDAPFSMAFTIIKTNALAFGIVINVTVGGGWTTPAGFETDYTLFNSDAAQQGSWLVRIDLPNKTVIVTPVV